MIEAVILQAVLIFINAIFASAEIAVISMNETKLKHMVQEGNKKAGKLSALTEQPAKFLSTIWRVFWAAPSRRIILQTLLSGN